MNAVTSACHGSAHLLIPPVSASPSVLVFIPCAACLHVWAIVKGDSFNPAPEMLINSAAAMAMASKQQHLYQPPSLIANRCSSYKNEQEGYKTNHRGLHRRALIFTQAVEPKVSIRLCSTDANVSATSARAFILRCLKSNSARRHQRTRVAAPRRVRLKRRRLLFSSLALFHNAAAVGAAPVCSAERLRDSRRQLKSTPIIGARR